MTVAKPPAPLAPVPSQAELDAAFKAVRGLVDARAGWYARLISDDMLEDVVRDALSAAAAARAIAAQAAAKR